MNEYFEHGSKYAAKVKNDQLEVCEIFIIFFVLISCEVNLMKINVLTAKLFYLVGTI